MDIPADVVQAVQDAQWALIALDGVTGISIGLREADGEPVNDELVVRITVRDAANLPDGLPDEIGGVPVFIVEGSIEPCGFPDNVRYPELHGGIEITNPALGSGTLGALVEDSSTGAILGLTCYHVVGNPGQAFPDQIWQATNPPLIATATIPDDDLISDSWRVDFPQTPLPLSLPFPLLVSTTDSAAIDLGPATAHGRTFSRAVAGDLGQPNLADAITATALPALGDKVRVRGFVTGPSMGIVLGLNHMPVWNVGAQFAVLLEQIEILAWPPGSRFAQKGDSGALVLANSDPTAVGLLWGVTDNGSRASASQIGRVESALGVSVVWA
jgi:hypothetical protein